ncbi:MAG: rhamnan synthesis F family protein [Bacteroidia bacterium]
MSKHKEESTQHIAVFCHLFYSNTYPGMVTRLKAIGALFSVDYFFNVVAGQNNEVLMETIRKDFPQAYILTSPNIGKDVGGKLAMLELYRTLEINSSLMLFIHDKISPQMLNGKKWSEELLKIIDPEKVQEIRDFFDKEPLTGLIGAKEHISDEYRPETGMFDSLNNDLLRRYIRNFNLKNKTFSFIAGNMFWVRGSVFENFFSLHTPLRLRSVLEAGNVDDTRQGTHTHALERIFSWIALDGGYTIKGV